MHHDHLLDTRGRTYQNRVLTIVAVLLAVLVTQRLELAPRLAEVEAFQQARDVPAPPNAAVQRVKMIQELEKIERRLDSIEKKLSKPLEVNVLSMPPVTVTE